jgi:hypothetical protein
MRMTGLAGVIGAIIGLSGMALAETSVLEDFDTGADARWRYIADGVMGGVSEGRASMVRQVDGGVMRLTGTVSTENNGGFIQVRRNLPGGLPGETDGLRMQARGNGEAYFVFLRTTELRRPWQFYSAEFTPGADWGIVDIPLSAFKASHDFLSQTIDPATVRSIGLVAYGRDHEADMSVGQITLY